MQFNAQEIEISSIKPKYSKTMWSGTSVTLSYRMEHNLLPPMHNAISIDTLEHPQDAVILFGEYTDFIGCVVKVDE